MPAYADSLVRLRHRYLREQLGAMATRARMLGGERLSFDQEARALYDADPPHDSPAHFDSLLSRLDSLVPGPGPLATRYQRFRERLNIPAPLVDTVFKTAIAACRARTLAHLALPPGERFDLEYVKGTSWNAYNWYKGGYHSLIQVNLDFPIAIDRAIDLACHEGYPGHHVYNALLEQALARKRGWVEITVYPLYSPESLIAEGSANYGIDMAFPADQRVRFERDSLFPLARLDPKLVERNAAVREVIERLNYARNEVARRYLDGQIDSAGAAREMTRYWLSTPAASAKTVRFINDYRAYVINYNLGRDLVAGWVRRTGGESEAGRWRAFESLTQLADAPAGSYCRQMIVGGYVLRRVRATMVISAAGHGPDDQERLGAPNHRLGQRRVGRLVGQVLLAGEEPQERPALLRDVVADRARAASGSAPRARRGPRAA